jgi:sugar transferase EpsL
MSNYQRFGKRMMDIIISTFLLVLLIPCFCILFILIRIKLGNPIIFKQERPGYLGKIFTLYKFRTMRDAFDDANRPLPDAKRITSFGNFLRQMSLDELPGLINVIRGEMSLIGPRPLLKEYLAHYTAEQARRHLVKPGITGWTQISGRNELSWEEKFKLDVWYVDNMNFLLDLKILFTTVYVVIKRQGVNAKGHITMPKFVDVEHHD